MAEVRTTSATGGQKGVKLARFDLIPIGPLTELAEHFGVGGTKYADHQWRNGYEWSKGYAALLRHLTAFWGGLDYDVCSNDPGGCSFVDANGEPFVAERFDACFNHTGSHHMAAVAWHAFALLEFKDAFPEHDDRHTTAVERPSEPEVDVPTERPRETWREAVIYWSARLERAYVNDGEHPEDATSEWEIEYADDALETAVRGMTEFGGDAKIVPDTPRLGRMREGIRWLATAPEVDEPLHGEAQLGWQPDDLVAFSSLEPKTLTFEAAEVSLETLAIAFGMSLEELKAAIPARFVAGAEVEDLEAPVVVQQIFVGDDERATEVRDAVQRAYDRHSHPGSG